LQRARRDGKRLGRPAGSKGRSKLDEHEETIKGYLAIELSQRKIAKHLGVAENTLRRFLQLKQLKP
jgi:DNA invertase Pin-like site-specific DNA recombinase